MYTLTFHNSTYFYSRFINMLVYIGLSITTASLGWNVYLAFFFSGLVEIPADLMCLYIMEKWGRRIPLCCFMVLGGLACLGNTFIRKLITVICGARVKYMGVGQKWGSSGALLPAPGY